MGGNIGKAMCIAVIASAWLAAGCTRTLDPLPVPNATPPTVGSEAPVPANHGRLLIEVVDGPTAVDHVLLEPQQAQRAQGSGGWRFREMPTALCTTPCVADMTLGNQLLAFPILGDADWTETEMVHVRDTTSVYRRRLSRYDHNSGAMFVLGIIAASIGGTAMITGVTLLPLGLSDDNGGGAAAGAISLGGGATLLTLGILGIVFDSPSYQPGSSVHFELEQ